MGKDTLECARRAVRLARKLCRRGKRFLPGELAEGCLKEKLCALLRREHCEDEEPRSYKGTFTLKLDK
jgi:hypothetical protein